MKSDEVIVIVSVILPVLVNYWLTNSILQFLRLVIPSTLVAMNVLQIIVLHPNMNLQITQEHQQWAKWNFVTNQEPFK